MIVRHKISCLGILVFVVFFNYKITAHNTFFSFSTLRFSRWLQSENCFLILQCTFHLDRKRERERAQKQEQQRVILMRKVFRD